MKTKQEIIIWLQEKVAKETRLQPENISVDTPFASLGLDSIVIVTLVADLENWLGTSLDPTVCWEYPTIGLLSEWLVTEHRGTSHAG